MTQIIIDIDALGAAIARGMRAKESEPLWDAKDCAIHLKITVESFRQYTASHPSFPLPTKLPSTRGKKGSNRWVASDVRTWALSFMQKRA